MRRHHNSRRFGPGLHDFVVFYFEIYQNSFEYTIPLKISPLYHFNLLNKKEALKRDCVTCKVNSHVFQKLHFFPQNIFLFLLIDLSLLPY